uniref:Si:ch211-186j3.6 n=1 Tax=Haplochromis burtoni TaxID=8153 RepID=A0A3Q2X3E2_HAPBU
VSEVASIKVDVLDTNDHQPTFPGDDVKLSLDDATALRMAIYTVTARDDDSGKNAELIYFALPRNGSFYVVPKTGDILLVDSILGLDEPIKFEVFARDRGWPPRTSQGITVEINPRQWPVAPSLNPQPGKGKPKSQEKVPARKSRSVLESDSPVLINVSEDAGIGSVVMNLNPVRFQSATFELVEPDVESSPVSVSRDTGDIIITRKLDRETEPLVEITVRVQDKRPEWYLVRVELTVTDVNDNIPEWSMVPAPYLAVVSPDASAGSLVYKLFAEDGDEGNNGEVEYFLSDGDGRFEVDRKTGQVRTTGLPLQRDREYLLTVVAADRLGSRSAPAVISVVAGPRPPQFTNASFTIAIPENTPEGQFLATPAVSFQKKPISYSLLINPSSLFSISAETGEISLTRPIDYESDQHRYLLLVRASEGIESMSSAAEVRVVITDENDCVPEFLQSIYSKDGVPETVTTATSLLQSANDCDSEENAELTYYTLSPDFTISPHGTIFPAGPLDYERPNHLYEFVVMAIDKGEVPRTGTTTVRIRMANVNDEAPEFSQHYRTFVSEDAGPNTLVATVLAKDPDGDGITYKITTGNEEGNFVIDNQKLIRLRSSPPPRLQGVEYVLNVTATDDNASGGPQALSSTAQVIVGVDDVNNNKPVFEKCQQYRESTSVLENQPAGTFVLQVHAVDADEGSNGRVTYGFMHKDSTVPAFSIHPETVIVTARKFDRERQREYAVTVTATDQAADPLIGICQLNILILDQNDNSPKFENLRYEFLREDTMIGTSFLRVAAHDDDFGTNAAITYSMSNEQPEYLRVNPLTGWVYVNQPISQQRTYITRDIVATDGGNRSSSVELAVTITNVKNQPPQWEKDNYNVVIPENTVRDTPIVTIKATSPLGDPRVTYNLEDGMVPETNMPVRFYLTPNREDGSASILVAEPLDYETTKNFMLRVRAQNVAAVPLAAFTTVYVNVTISYSLLEDRSGDHQYFRIDPELGFIYTQAVFDRETKSSYLLEVQSVDGWESARPGKHGQPNSTAYVRIFISDVNDNKPEFAQASYEVDVDEDADVGFAILTVSANDGDERYKLHLLASDGKWEDYTTVTVNVVNKNDEAPVFTVNEYYGSVTEELDGSPVFVLQVTATDPDKDADQEALRYSLHGQGADSEFIIDEVTGKIYAQRTLDREERAVWRFVVLATDEGGEGLTGFTDVIINVWDINDNAPIFTCAPSCHGEVAENSAAGTSVMEMTATDLDDSAVGQNAVLSYRIVGSLDATNAELGGVPTFSEMFTINPTTGTITVGIGGLDREQVESYLLVVEARDGGGMAGTGTATILIKDVNDHAPRFTDHSCLARISENAEPNARMPTTVLGKVYSPDPDDWDNKTYVFEGHVPYFILNKRTGFLIIKENAPPGTYQFQVRVSDGIWPDAVSTVTVHVRELRDDAIYNSGSLRLAITAKEFIELRGKQRSRYELLVDFLSEMLSVPPDDVNIFSLMDVKERMLDVRFAVHSGPSFLQPEKMHGYLAAHKQKLQSFLQVSVFQVRVDECPSSECGGTGGCSNTLNVRDTPTVVDCGTMSLVSVTVESTAVCSCPGREQSHQPCATYPRNPCYNGGVCVDTQHGYCQCPAQFEGPECQQNKHSFHGNGYAWFPPMMPCFESHVSLEFITDVADGLVLYSGPLAQLQAWDHEDFMAILIDGTPTLKINHGSGTVVLQLPGNVNVADRRWHRLDVRSNSKEVRFTLDRCSGAAVKELVGSWLTSQDHSSCEVMGVTPNTDHLNMSQVLQLGGVNEDIPYIYPQLQHKHFTGCVRNLIVDSKLYDLGSPADSQSSSPGCLTTDSSCVNMGYPSCGHRGRCHGEWGSFSCQCIPGYTGHQEVPEYSFDGHSHVRYQLASPLPARRTWIQVLVRTRKHSSVLFSLISKEQSEYLRLEGLLCVFYNLGDGDYNLTLPTYRLDNGEWHEVFLDRHDNEMTLRMDGGGGQREVSGLQGRSREIIIDPTVVMLGNTFPSGINKSFQCMRDLRLNGRYMPLDSQPRDGVSQVSVQGLSVGCSSDSCKRNQCSPPFTCVDLWRVHECCPPGHMISVNGTKKSCVYTLCAMRPCHRGTCVAQSPSKFTCHCPEGYRGHRCETTLAIYREDVGLSFSSLFAICICFMALLLLLGIFLYTRWRSYKGLKEGVYHVSAHHDGWEDIRENVLNYDEEGGGEEDQNAYDMAELQKSLQPSPAQSVQYCRSRALHHPPPPHHHHHHHLLHQAPPVPPSSQPLDALSRTTSSTTLPPSAASTSSTATTTTSLRRDVPPTRLPAQGQARPSQLARRSLSFSSQDLARYLCEIIRDADQHPDTGPFDSLQVFSTEGGGSPAGSLSSFSSAGLDGGSSGEGGVEARREETLGEWGPRFEKLRALYERAEASDL